MPTHPEYLDVFVRAELGRLNLQLLAEKAMVAALRDEIAALKQPKPAEATKLATGTFSPSPVSTTVQP